MRPATSPAYTGATPTKPAAALSLALAVVLTTVLGVFPAAPPASAGTALVTCRATPAAPLPPPPPGPHSEAVIRFDVQSPAGMLRVRAATALHSGPQRWRTGVTLSLGPPAAPVVIPQAALRRIGVSVEFGLYRYMARHHVWVLALSRTERLTGELESLGGRCRLSTSSRDLSGLGGPYGAYRAKVKLSYTLDGDTATRELWSAPVRLEG